METINDRMQLIADSYCGGNKAAFAKAIGLAPTSISNYLGKQRASKPSADLLAKIVNSLDVDAMWLLTGKGTMKRNVPSKQVDEAPEAESESIHFLKQQIEFLNSQVTSLSERNEMLEEELVQQLREKKANVG